MGNAMATANAPRWSPGRWERQPRPLHWFWLALLAHLAALWWLAGVPLPLADERPAVRVRLVPASESPPPEAVTVPPARQPAPGQPERVPPAPPPADEPGLTPRTLPYPVPAVSVLPAEAPGDETRDRQRPPPPAQEILSRLRRYRVDDETRLTPAGPGAPARPPALGLANQSNLFAELDRPLPALPFAPGEMGLDFYAAGVRGDIARTFDRITPEFGFVTGFGLEVKCRYVLIVVSCGWRER